MTHLEKYIRPQFEQCLKKVLPELKKSEIKDEMTFDALGFDSLDKVELIMEIEKECRIIIPDEKVENIKTIGEAFQMTMSLIKKSINK
jgi:acyl carrier protein